MFHFNYTELSTLWFGDSWVMYKLETLKISFNSKLNGCILSLNAQNNLEKGKEILPPPYIHASIMEEIHDTWLLVTSKMTSISLKKTVMDFGKA